MNSRVIFGDFVELLDSLDKTELQDEISTLDTAVTALQRASFNSGRAFIRFNDGFNVGDAGFEAATVRNKNMLYTARNDKAPDNPTAPNIILPTDAEILGAGGYPYPIEFTHIGGTGLSTDVNLVRIFDDTGTTLLQTLLFDQFTVVNKASASDPWEFTTASFDAANFVLGSGLVNISTTEILNASNITTELNGVVILQGTAFIIKTGGDWGQYSGDRTIPDNAIIMATVDGPSIANDPNNQDWFLFTENLLNASQVALLDNFVQDGITFQASRNIEIDPSNVDTFEAIATGTPIVRQIGGNTPGQNRSIVYTDVPLQMPDLVGGRLTLSIEFEISTSGSVPAWTFMRIEYPGGIQFDFPLQGAAYQWCIQSNYKYS